MSEVDSSPENPKIPEHWEFEEKEFVGLYVDNIDLERHYLAFSLPPVLGSTEPRRIEYFFKENGKASDRRRSYDICDTTLGSSSITHWGENAVVHCHFFNTTDFTPEGLKNLDALRIDIADFRSLEEIKQKSWKEDWVNRVGYTKDGRIQSIELGKFFVDNEELVEVSLNQLALMSDKTGLDPKDYSCHEMELPSNFSKPTIDWDVKTEEINGVEVPFLTVRRQLEGSSSIEETEAPVQIDMKKIIALALSQPWYPANIYR